jgi:anti-sigma regulatory factor (Ser/Thr protein kinase)
MTTKEYILKEARSKGVVTARSLAARLRITRQTLAQHFRELVAQKKIIKIGATRGARYIPYTPARAQKFTRRADAFRSRYALRGLEEDRVFREIALRLGLAKRLSASAFRIANYAFTEMLNNAIDHSGASHAEVDTQCDHRCFSFAVLDRGIGVFENVRRKYSLQNHFEAAEHLLKGKQTTRPERHSGQGIFFTSKIADRFSLESARLCLTVDNVLEDVLLKDIRARKGTLVRFALARKSRKDLKKLFDEYSDRDYEFDKTKLVIKLSEAQGEHMSRSQARRLLFGLEKFRRIVLDFRKVDEIGQGFADEIFRVFQEAHPAQKIEAVNAGPSVTFMIGRAQRAAP